MLRNLVLGEFKRLSNRIERLKDGYFDLRNKKPMIEVIKYYTDYVTQLNKGNSTVKPHTRATTADEELPDASLTNAASCTPT